MKDGNLSVGEALPVISPPRSLQRSDVCAAGGQGRVGAADGSGPIFPWQESASAVAQSLLQV